MHFSFWSFDPAINFASTSILNAVTYRSRTIQFVVALVIGHNRIEFGDWHGYFNRLAGSLGAVSTTVTVMMSLSLMLTTTVPS